MIHAKCAPLPWPITRLQAFSQVMMTILRDTYIAVQTASQGLVVTNEAGTERCMTSALQVIQDNVLALHVLANSCSYPASSDLLARLGLKAGYLARLLVAQAWATSSGLQELWLLTACKTQLYMFSAWPAYKPWPVCQSSQKSQFFLMHEQV